MLLVENVYWLDVHLKIRKKNKAEIIHAKAHNEMLNTP